MSHAEPSFSADSAEDSRGLRCLSLDKHYPGVHALKSLDFEAAPGRVHAVIGENGAGKSTFIRLVAGSEKPDSGTIELFGDPLEADSPIASLRSGVGVAYQELSLMPDLTVAENIWLPHLEEMALAPVRRSQLTRATEELFDWMEAPFVSPAARVRQLSIAQRHVVEIVAAAASKPRLLILDEATAALSANEAAWALGLARRFASMGSLVLFVSHRLAEIRVVADDVTVLRDGARILTRQLTSITDDEMVEAMLGRRPDFMFPPAINPPRESVVLSVRDLRVGHRVRDVSFDMREGEILGLGGIEGQGQSEVLSSLFGLLPYQGEVRVVGRLERISSPRKAMKVGLTLIPEDRRLQGLLMERPIRHNTSLSILRTISTLPGVIRRTYEKGLVERELSGVNARYASIEDRVETLSGGNQQKVVVAKLLLTQNRILLFNDLTRGIDVGSKASIFELARKLTAEGYSIIMYSSEAQELVHMCDRVIVMTRGTLSTTLEGDEITEEAIVRSAFQGAVDSTGSAFEDAPVEKETEW